MKYLVKINDVKSTDELEGAWNEEDFKELLIRFEFPDADQLKPTELKEYLFMAIADFEPNEAAAVLLDYKLSDTLSDGQIDNLSNEMLQTKVSERYSDINIHRDLFNINQLLYDAYNGKFPKVSVNIVEFEITDEQNNAVELTKENALKALSCGLSDNNLLNRLLGDQLEGKAPFPEAEDIVWDLQSKDNNLYSMTISEKWLTKDEITKPEFDCIVEPYVEPDEDS